MFNLETYVGIIPQIVPIELIWQKMTYKYHQLVIKIHPCPSISFPPSFGKIISDYLLASAPVHNP